MLLLCPAFRPSSRSCSFFHNSSRSFSFFFSLFGHTALRAQHTETGTHFWRSPL